MDQPELLNLLEAPDYIDGEYQMQEEQQRSFKESPKSIHGEIASCIKMPKSSSRRHLGMVTTQIVMEGGDQVRNDTSY